VKRPETLPIEQAVIPHAKFYQFIDLAKELKSFSGVRLQYVGEARSTLEVVECALDKPIPLVFAPLFKALNAQGKGFLDVLEALTRFQEGLEGFTDRTYNLMSIVGDYPG